MNINIFIPKTPYIRRSFLMVTSMIDRLHLLILNRMFPFLMYKTGEYPLPIAWQSTRLMLKHALIAHIYAKHRMKDPGWRIRYQYRQTNCAKDINIRI